MSSWFALLELAKARNPIAALLAATLLAPAPAAVEQPAYRRADLPVEVRVRDLLARMTVAEKARQLDMYAGVPDLVDKSAGKTHAASDAAFRPDRAAALWGNLGVGSIHDLYPQPQLANDIQRWVIAHSRLGIPALFIEEGLHGFSGGTVFPAPIGLSATWDRAMARDTGAAIASETRVTGVDMILAPVLDLARDPRWGRVEEDFGEDPYLTGQLGLAYVSGAQGNSLRSDLSVVAEPKHFAAHGSPESGLNTSPVHIGERELRTIMLKSFEPAIRQGHAMGVMAAYHEIDGIPITADPFLLLHILRTEWGFRGFVLSDLGAIRQLYDIHDVAATPKDAVCLALRSGVDMQFYDFYHATYQNAIVSCVRDGTLPMAALDRAAGAVLRVKFLLGLFDRPLVDPSLAAGERRSPAHLALSLASARESMTLLKNDGHLLPLPKTLRRIAVIGPNAAVARYGDYADPTSGMRVSILDGVRQAVPNAAISFADGHDAPAAVAAARGAQVAIVGMGERQGISGEGSDRDSLDLPGDQEALLEAIVATGTPVVLVLENGRPLSVQWAAQHVPAILEAWYPGEFGGTAIAQTIFGDNNPAGRLSVTVARNVGQLPVYYDHDPSKWHGYVEGPSDPLFPFGFGLSYTTFSYINLSVRPPAHGSASDVIVSVDVTNTGSRPGDEVVQLYVRQDVGSVETPVQALKGFERISLQAGETKHQIFNVKQSDLALWNSAHRWVVEPGPYTVMVGGSSADTVKARFRL